MTARLKCPATIATTVAATVLCLVSLALAAAPPPGTSANPHLAQLECSECHLRIPERGKTSHDEVIAGLAKDPVTTCRACHPDQTDANHHPARVARNRTIPPGLPTGRYGDIVCATCHDVHQERPTPYLLRGFDTGRYLVRMDMCLDCHSGRFQEMDPHGLAAGAKGCTTCHLAVPATAATASLKPNLARICDFCHDVTRKGHPLNTDPGLDLPASLPRDADGKTMCGTCHVPHGSGTMVHYLRPEYVTFLEKDRNRNPHTDKGYSGCIGCHLSIASDKAAMRKSLRFGGDDLAICLSCHGTMESCHPVLVRPTGEMAPGAELPLSPEGWIRCTTCHDPMPKSGTVGVRLREDGGQANALCFRCHRKDDLAGLNPHTSMNDRTSCRFCHDTMSDPKNDEAAKVSFISNTRLICLRCHAQKEHPSKIDHMVVPEKYIPPEGFKVDRKGKITCTTCHNPHIDAGASGVKRQRFVVPLDGVALCSLCHRR